MTMRAILSCLCLLLSAAVVQAGSISVSPIRADVPAPSKSASISLKNDGAQPVTIQIRIFKWGLKNGQDDYAESDDVVATPPVATVPPGGEALVRILRLDQKPVVGEEPYRLIVDEIPDANRIRNMGVNVAVRYAIPVFFLNGDAAQSRLAWSVRTEGGKRMLVATNTGDKSRRISNLRLGGVTLRPGLAGYVLGHSTRMWPLPTNATAARVLADSDQGVIDAPLSR